MFFKEFFFFLCDVSLYNFADDNTQGFIIEEIMNRLHSFIETINNLVSILQSESGCAINWFRVNSVINPVKFQALLLHE